MNVVAVFQNKVRWFMQNLIWASGEAQQLDMLYWKSDIVTKLATLQDTDAATVNSKLTKAQISSALTMIEAFLAFLKTGTATQADYAATAFSVLNGTTARTEVLSVATEQFGDRVVELFRRLLETVDTGILVLNLYFANQINEAVAVLDDYRILFGGTVQVEEIEEALVVVEQLKKMAFGEVYTTGDYLTIAYEWAVVDEIPER